MVPFIANLTPASFDYRLQVPAFHSQAALNFQSCIAVQKMHFHDDANVGGKLQMDVDGETAILRPIAASLSVDTSVVVIWVTLDRSAEQRIRGLKSGDPLEIKGTLEEWVQ